MNILDNSIRTYVPFIENDTFTIAISIVLILYAVFVAPNISLPIAVFLNNVFVKLILFFIIAYISRFNPTVALIATIAVIVSLMKINEYKTTRELMTSENKLLKRKLRQKGIPTYQNTRGDYPMQTKIYSRKPPINEENNIKITNQELHKDIVNVYPNKPIFRAEENNNGINGNNGNNNGINGEFNIDNLQLLNCAGRESINYDSIKPFSDNSSGFAKYTKDN